MTVAVKNNNNTPLVVPKAIRRKAGFRSGQELEIKASGGVITIVPKPAAAGNEYTAAERRAVDRGISQSEKEYRAGKHAGPFATADEFLADLHRESANLGTKRKPARK